MAAKKCNICCSVLAYIRCRPSCENLLIGKNEKLKETPLYSNRIQSSPERFVQFWIRFESQQTTLEYITRWMGSRED